MGKAKALLFSIFITFSLFSLTVPATADDGEDVPLRVFLPEPLTPKLSADGNTLYDGGSILVVVADPKPSTLRRVPAPDRVSDQTERATASFSITYITNGSTDAWGVTCETFPEAAKDAFNAAANIWANTITSNVPITINACWADLGSSSTLGYSGGQPLRRDFSGATQSNTWYAGSLANALNGSDLDPTQFDMHITYNRNFTWYYGTDGNTPAAQMDLMSVVLHEICHGLNFSGSMSYAAGKGSWGYGTGYPNIYDVFMRDGSGTQLINTSTYANGSTSLGNALTSDNIWFHGTNAMSANGNQRVKMYAPATWTPGSSYSHLDYNTFNNTSNQLMVYAISAGEAIHDPGAVTEGLLKDIGWQISGTNTPTVTTAAVTSITSNSAVSGGNVTSDGGTPVTARGVCWSTSANPTTADTCTSNGTGTGTFSSTITGLSPGSTYHVRAYATNTGTGYGSDLTFATAGASSIGEAVDNTALSWTTGGNGNWSAQSAVSHYGGDAAQSGSITNDESTWLQTTVTGPGTLSFYWKVSSEADYDYLRFYIDSVEKNKISGNVDWQQKSYAISSGSHTLKWTYTKDYSLSGGSDAGWLDRVVSTVLECPDCSGNAVVLSNVTFSAGTTCECVGTTSITMGTGVTVENGATVTFKAPLIEVGGGFHAESGSSVTFTQ